MQNLIGFVSVFCFPNIAWRSQYAFAVDNVRDLINGQRIVFDRKGRLDRFDLIFPALNKIGRLCFAYCDFSNQFTNLNHKTCDFVCHGEWRRIRIVCFHNLILPYREGTRRKIERIKYFGKETKRNRILKNRSKERVSNFAFLHKAADTGK